MSVLTFDTICTFVIFSFRAQEIGDMGPGAHLQPGRNPLHGHGGFPAQAHGETSALHLKLLTPASKRASNVRTDTCICIHLH